MVKFHPPRSSILATSGRSLLVVVISIVVLMIPKGHLIRLNSNRHLFTLAQASAEAEEVNPGTRPNFAAPAGALFTLTQIAGHQTGACLPLRRLQDTKQAPVYPYADCRAPNRRLFTITQIAGPQTGACLPLRRPLPRPRKSILVPAKLRCPRRGPVWLLVRHFSVSLYMASISAA